MKYTYLNGNYIVDFRSSSGIKTYRALRADEPVLKAEFPDSIDLKITNSCSFGCPFCHESSIPGGKSFNLENTKRILSELPEVGIEVAIGGGDILECDPTELNDFLTWCINKKLQLRATLNAKDFLDPVKEKQLQTSNILDQFEAIGVSISSFEEYIKIKELDSWLNLDSGRPIFGRSSTVVFHVIAGILPIDDLTKIIRDLHNTLFVRNRSILVLGYKSWGRGINFTPNSLEAWKRTIQNIIYNSRFKNNKANNTILGFDNLAIEQLGIKDALLEREWSERYMGDEFSHSMYIDAVEEKFAPTSRSKDRVDWNKTNGLLDYFKNNRVDDKPSNY